MKKHPATQYAWSLAVPLALAALLTIRTLSPGAPRITQNVPPSPTAASTSAARPAAPNPVPLLPVPGVAIAVPLPPVAESPALLPGEPAPAALLPKTAVIGTSLDGDPRFVAVQRQVGDGDVDQARAQLEQLARDANATVAAHAQFLLGQVALTSGDTAGGEQAFRTYLSKYPAGADAPRVAFGLGEFALRQGQRDQAASYLHQYLATTSDHALDGYAQLDLAQIDQASGNSAAALPLLQRAVEAGLPLSEEAKAAETVGAAMIRNWHVADAVDWYATLAARPSNTPSSRAHYQFLQAGAWQRAGQTQQAIAEYRRLLDGGAAGSDTGGVIAALNSLGAPPTSFAAGEAYLKAGQFDQATTSLGNYLDQNPAGPDAATARYDRGRAMLDQHAGAAAQIDRFVATAPSDPRLGAAVLLEGQALAQSGSAGPAVSLLTTFAQQHKSDASAPRALADAAQDLKQSGQSDAAVALEQQLMASFPASPLAPTAAFDVGWADYENLDFNAAQAVWQSVLDRWPSSPGSAPSLLWLGKVEQRAGNTAAVQHAYQLAWKADPGDYYAFRARELAGGTAASVPTQPLVQPTTAELMKERSDLETWLATWTGPTGDGRGQPYLGAPIAQGTTLARIQDFAATGLTADEQNEVQEAMTQFAGDGRSLYALADTLDRAGLTRASMAAAYQLLLISPAPNAYQSPLLLQRLVYPLPYEDLIVQSSQQYGVDPLLLVALIRQESAFDPRARSVTDAIGLTQFEPGTASGVAAQLGLTGFTQSDLYQPRTAIQMGAAYLASQVKAFGGNPFFALAAYNAGGGSVQSWLADNPRRDLDLLVEEIPFQQTSEYVRNIYRFYQEYQLLYRAPG
ncbi:MAG TPA: transglycosylase SLT domain-containing protein [Chloroflexota bacterium]|nr:transglycosylase SLT domain-containing protein [Chloroflexota bacterium]